MMRRERARDGAMRQRARNQQETRWAHIMRFVTDTTPLSALAAVLADMTPRRRRALQGHIGEVRQRRRNITSYLWWRRR